MAGILAAQNLKLSYVLQMLSLFLQLGNLTTVREQVIYLIIFLFLTLFIFREVMMTSKFVLSEIYVDTVF